MLPLALASVLLIRATNAHVLSATVYAFDKDKAGGRPAAFQAYSGDWVVQADTSAPSPPHALAQAATRDAWPGIVLKDSDFADVSVTVSFKPVSGQEDQAAGIIVRYQDSGNFYVCRANANEDNVILFKFVKGSRSEIKSANVKVESGQWGSLRMDAVGDSLSCYLNGKRVLTAKPGLYQRGKVGLWTKADSVTYFDNLEVKPLVKKPAR
jgi:hypothetical protein